MRRPLRQPSVVALCLLAALAAPRPAWAQARAFCEMEFEDLFLPLSRSGVFAARRADKVVFTEAELVVKAKGASAWALQSRCQVADGFPKPDKDKGMVTFAGKIADNSLPAPVEFKQVVSIAAQGVSLKYTLTAAQRVELDTVGLSLSPTPQASDLVLAIDNDFLKKTGRFSIARVSEVTVGQDKAQQAALSFGAVLVNVEARDEGDRMALRLTVPGKALSPNDPLTLEITVGPQSFKRGAALNALLAEAKAARARDDYGKAIAAYRKICDSATFDEADKLNATTELRAIERRASDLLDSIQRAVDKALSTKADRDLRIAEEDLQAATPKLAGTTHEQPLAALRNRLLTVRQAETGKVEAEAKKLFDKAIAFYDAESLLWAEVCCNNITKRFPNTSYAEKSKQLLEQIANAKEKRVVTDRWIRQKLSEAKTYISNNQPTKAVSVYEEIIKNYPKNPLTEDARKGLAELQAKTSAK